jgi:hypothetical protein
VNLRQLIRPGWSMALGERAALAGIVAEVKPTLAVEIGVARGGSLRVIAEHSREVHGFDFDPQVQDPPANAVFHVGDYHVLLQRLLEAFANVGRNVDFVLVDGDHSAAGVERDLRDLLASPAVGRTVIVLHDTRNDSVRAGIERSGFRESPKLVHADLDFVSTGPVTYVREMWGGLGLLVIDDAGDLTATEFAHFGTSAGGAVRSPAPSARTESLLRLTKPVRRSVRVAREAAAVARRHLRAPRR